MTLHVLSVAEGDKEAATPVALAFGYLKNADKNSTLYQYRVYCERLLDTILERAKNEPKLFLNNKRKCLDNDDCLSL